MAAQLLDINPGRLMRDLRTRRGWRQADAAERFSEVIGHNISIAQISHWEAGRRPMVKIPELLAAAEVFSVSPAYFLGPEFDHKTFDPVLQGRLEAATPEQRDLINEFLRQLLGEE